MALAECCISGERRIGATVELDGIGVRTDALLFGESQSRILLSIGRNHIERLEEMACNNGVPLEVIGEVGGEHLLIDELINLDVARLHAAWDQAIEKRLA